MIGRTLGHYRLIDKIGSGGMGDVYRARDEHLGRDVAVKVLPEGMLADESARRRFRGEALALSKLNHPNIETVHDFDTQDGVDFLVIEYIPGVTLDDRLAEGSLPEAEILRLGTQLAEGLGAAHAQGVVHRDLKPGNLRVSADGRLKILDFGLARFLEPAAAPEADVATRTMSVMGTFPYMAPEQLRGEPADPRTDIYAAGVVLYEMATGQLPFQERLPTALSDSILHHLPPPPGRLRPDLDARLEEIILKCLEKDPDLRYQSSRDMLADFRRLQTASKALSALQPLSQGRQASDVAKRGGRRVPHPRARIGIPIAIAAVALLAFVLIRDPFGWRASVVGRPDAGAIRSLAVLPFADLSGDDEQSYFVDGMTEAVITDLSKIRAIKVISRTSVMRYKGSTRSLPEIARELSVDAIVEGSVLRDGDRVRISAQLIDSRTDAHLWAETYQRDLRDVLSLQSEVAQAIAGGIRVNLTSDESARLAGTRRVDSRAYDAYLKGRYLWNQRTKEGLSRSLEYFRQAIAMDPGYAVAHAGLASAYAMGPSYFILPATEAYPQAQAAARKALELDDALAEAHATLGWTKLEYEYDWTGAEAEFKRAIELEPGNVTAHQWYTVLLVCTGRFAEARAENELALGLDPFSPPGNLWKAFLHFYSREFDKAVAELENLHEMHPQYGPPSQWIPIALALAGRHEEAAASCERYVAESPQKETTGYCLAFPYAVAGRKEEARAVLIENREHTTHFTQLTVFAALGENDEAIAELERAYAEREWQVPTLSVDPRLDPLRSDPRFRDVVSRMRYPGSAR